MISSVELSQFQTQQVYCVRDRHGSITEGGQVKYVFFFPKHYVGQKCNFKLKSDIHGSLSIGIIIYHYIGVKFMSNNDQNNLNFKK